MRPRTRATITALAIGTAALLAFPGAKGGKHGLPTTTTAPATTTTVVATTTIASNGDGPATLAASLGFGTLNSAVSDDFTGLAGTKPSSTRWDVKNYTDAASLTNWGGWTNVSLDGTGNLDIVATRQADGRWSSGFLSGRVSYQGPRFIVVRAQVPAGAGTFAAPIWEWDAPYGSSGPELDVSEQLGREPTAYHATVHAGTGSPQVSNTVTTLSTLAAGFHNYEAATYADHVDFFLDEIKVDTITAAQLGSWGFTTAGRVLNIDLAMGGWGGTIDPSLSSVHELVDYEHVYTP